MSDTATTGQTPTDPGTAAPAAEPTTLITEPAATPAVEQTQTEAPTDKPAEVDPNAKPEGEAEAKPEDKPAGAPETYEDFTLPEGVTLDAELGTDLKAIAKDLNLPQEQAQKLADLALKHGQKLANTQAEQLAAARNTWANESKADKEFGGDKFEANMAVAKKAADTYASDSLKALLDQTGLGNHPEIIRLFHKVGQTISEDRFDGGRSTHSAGQQTAAERLYGNKQT